jgi:hypothetical protein
MPHEGLHDSNLILPVHLNVAVKVARHLGGVVPAVQYSAVQYSAVQCSTVQCGTMRYNAVQCSEMQYNVQNHSPLLV